MGPLAKMAGGIKKMEEGKTVEKKAAIIMRLNNSSIRVNGPLFETRFDNVPFDNESEKIISQAKDLASQLENLIVEKLDYGRAIKIALEKLEETYVWIMKAIRDEQVIREANQVKLDEMTVRGEE
jgi:hypothetical protein